LCAHVFKITLKVTLSTVSAPSALLPPAKRKTRVSGRYVTHCLFSLVILKLRRSIGLDASDWIKNEFDVMFRPPFASLSHIRISTNHSGEFNNSMSEDNHCNNLVLIILPIPELNPRITSHSLFLLFFPFFCPPFCPFGPKGPPFSGTAKPTFGAVCL
jgi:hypothetical protein